MNTLFKDDNISYDLESDTRKTECIRSYWTEDRKAKAIPIGFEGTPSGVYVPQVGVPKPVIADLTVLPFSAGGKLYFTKEDRDYVGSAQVLGKKNIVLTAAHCAQNNETGAVYDNFLLEIQYDQGKCEEQLTFKKVALKSYWFNAKDNAEYKWDYCIAVLDEPAQVDALPFSTDAIDNARVRAFGYPCNQYDGKRMVYATMNNVKSCDDGMLQASWNEMGGGCSGGAWVLGDSAVVVGLNSICITDKDNRCTSVKSPILNEDFQSLYDFALNELK